MDIKYTAKKQDGAKLPGYKYSKIERKIGVEDYISEALRGSGGGNDLDTIEQEQRFTREAFGRLVSILSDKCILGVADVRQVAYYTIEEDEADHELVKS